MLQISGTICNIKRLISFKSEESMTKTAIREQRRAQRIAKRNRQRTIIGIIVLLVLALIAFLVYRDYTTKSQPYPIGKLDTTPPKPSANAITTASGLIYEDLQVGDGATAKSGDTITVNYTGWLTDGTKFDSSIDRGQTSDFTLGTGNVIAGWDEGVVGMRVNGTRLLEIPPSLGYGSTAKASIPANSTLVFEVQLVAIK
jgi:FKBP-type peptidyl-prolyl cis-trans isomerase FkpA